MAETPNPEPRDVHLPEPAVPERAAAASADAVRLALRVEEFERRLKARTQELETEIRSKERLRARVTELTKRADELQETAAALHREAVSATALSRELDETLRVASEARRQLGDALAAERGRREAAEAGFAEIRSHVDALRASEARAEAALAAAVPAASEERRQLAEALAAERVRREAAEKDLAASRASVEELRASEARAQSTLAEAAEARVRTETSARELAALETEHKRRDSELKDARLHVQALRQKTEGHETHIESLRAEVESARVQAADRAEMEARALRAEAAAAQVVARAKEFAVESAAARAALEKANVERAEERGGLEAELRAVRAKSREVLENAEAIRREGVEAFESSREMKIRMELEEDKRRREHDDARRTGSARANSDHDELEALKGELRDRAERESRELRDALEAERSRLYQDLDAERRAHEAAPPAGESSEDRIRRLHAESDERREGIAREVRQYIAPEPKPAPSAPPAPAPAPSPAADEAPRVPAPPAARLAMSDPSLREPWQTKDEMKFAVWIAVVRHQFFNVDFVVSRAVVYVALTAAVIGTITVTEEIGTYVFYNNTDLTYGFLIAISMGVGSLTGKIKELLDHAVDHFIFRDRANQREALDLIAGYILDAETFDDVYRALLQDAAYALKLSFGGILARQPDGSYELAANFDWPADCVIRLGPSDELTRAITRTRGALTFSGKDTRMIQQSFPNEKVTFAAPLFYGRIVAGIVVYGHNVSGLDLDPDEREHLVRVVSHASIALNAIELAKLRAAVESAGVASPELTSELSGQLPGTG